MLLVYILIAMLPGCSGYGQSELLLKLREGISALTSHTEIIRVTTPSYDEPEAPAEADFSDFAASLAGDERFSSIIFLVGLAVLFLLIIYFFNRYRANRRFSEMTRFSSAPEENAFVSGISGNSPDPEAGFSGFSPSYISTESAPAILVAEDDEEIRLFITNTLRLNYRVIAVQDGLKAFRKAFETIPDLVITNSLMPGMDGVSLCHLLKETMATSHIPVIILNTDPGLRPEGPVPADGCIRANFDARSLLIEIRNFLDQRKHLYAAFRKQLPQKSAIDEFFSAEVLFMDRLDNVLKAGYHRESFGVDDLIEELSLTKLQLFRKLKVLTNKTPGDYIRNFRINEAKRLLSRENCQVSDVAIKTGFANVSGFSKAFREVTGIPPIEYAVHIKSLSGPITDQ